MGVTDCTVGGGGELLGGGGSLDGGDSLDGDDPTTLRVASFSSFI